MTRPKLALATAAAFAAITWAWSQIQPAQPLLAANFPAGAVLFLEARDFNALLGAWNGSLTKTAWTASANYQTFSRSRIFLRLADAQAEFGAAAGLPPDTALLAALAGAQSALAFYDIGQMRFLYSTRLQAARIAETAIWRARANWSPRNAGGAAYFVRTDPVSKRTAAFASQGDMLWLATDESLLASALAKPSIPLASEDWYRSASRQAGNPGELRLAIRLAGLVSSPHFRSYWVQRNVSELRQYTGGIVDLDRTATEIAERRTFLRTVETPAPPNLSELARAIPGEAGFYRVWQPAPAEIASLLESKVLAPYARRVTSSKFAPPGSFSESGAGSESALETRIDEPPLEGTEPRLESSALAPLAANVDAAAVIDSAVVLRSTLDWNPNAVQSAIRNAVEKLWTTQSLGLAWTTRNGFDVLDGLAPVAFRIEGRLLIVTPSEALGARIAAALRGPVRALDAQTTSLAGFNHAAQRGPFESLMRQIDYAARPPAAPADPNQPQPSTREPDFFSENIVSLSNALSWLNSMDVTTRTNALTVHQTVRYRVSR